MDKTKKNEQKVDEKMGFTTFYSLLVRKKHMKHLQISTYAPILYNLDKTWFDAVVDYLQTGKEAKLEWGEYSTQRIINGYGVEEPDYIDAVVVLDCLKKMGPDACYAFFPYIVE